MADTKVSALTAVSSMSTGLEYGVNESGTSKKVTWATAVGGIAGGGSFTGGTGSGDDLTLNSTSHATKGKVLFGSVAALDEANTRLGIGTQSPSMTVEVQGSSAVALRLDHTGGAADEKKWDIFNSSAAKALIIRPMNDSGVAGTDQFRLVRSTNELTEIRVGTSSGDHFTIDLANGFSAWEVGSTNPSANMENDHLAFYVDGSDQLTASWTNSSGTNKTLVVGTLT